MSEKKDVHALKILVVDDEEFIGRHLMMTLFSIGLKDVTYVDGGDKAMEAMHDNRFDLVLTDKEMQPVNGFDLISNLRASPCDKSMRIVMVSADDTEETRAEITRRGGDGFIAKPYSPDSIRQALGNLFPDLVLG